MRGRCSVEGSGGGRSPSSMVGRLVVGVFCLREPLLGVGKWWNTVHGAAPRMTRGQVFGDHGPASRGVWLGGLLAGWCKGRLDLGCPTYLHAE